MNGIYKVDNIQVWIRWSVSKNSSEKGHKERLYKHVLLLSYNMKELIS